MSTDTDSMIAPPPALLTQVTDPNTKQTNYAFPLQTEAWLKMQGVVQTALAFPLTAEDFASTYGTFSDEGTVETAVAILGAISKTAGKYGDPQTLISELPTFEQAATAPASIYGHAVWLAAQTQLAAQEIGSSLQQGLNDIKDDTDPKQRLQDLTDLLTDPQQGVITYATTLQGYITNFQNAVKAFYDELNPELTGDKDSLKWYLQQSGNVLADAKNDVSADEKQIDQLNANIKQLNDEYIGFTVAASVAPVLLLFPIFGPLLAVADAATFGTLAVQVKNQINGLETQLQNAEEEEKKKTALVTVLGNFNLKAQDVEDDGVAFLQTIATLQSGWTEFVGQIKTRLSSLTPEDLADWSKFMQKQGFEKALKGWQLIDTTAETFFQTGVVQFAPATESWLTSEAPVGRSER